MLRASSGAEDGVVPQDKLDEFVEAFLHWDAEDLLGKLFQGKDQHVEVVRLGQQLALKYKQLYEKELAATVAAAAAAAAGPKTSSAKTDAKHGAKDGASMSGAAAATFVANSVTEETKAETDEEESMPTDLLQAMFNDNQELKEQLNSMKAVNRITEARVEDLKHALSAEEKKHQKEIEELKHRVLRTTDDKQDEVHNLRNMLESAGEEKNLLVNTFECKELEWKTQIEDMRLEMEEAKRKCESETTRFQADIAQLEVSAREAMERKYEDGQQDGIALCQSASALGWLRCPMRHGTGSHVSAARCPMPGGTFRPMCCQEACWNVVSAICGCVAFWCNLRDYTIQEASKEAGRIWGSSMLNGKSFFSLAVAPSSVNWLKTALHSHQRIAYTNHPGERGPPGFIVRELGWAAFTARSGESFDASVLAAHFPAETACSRPASLLVILKAKPKLHGRERDRAPGPPGGQSESTRSSGTRGSHSGRLGSARSGVSISSVSPSERSARTRSSHNESSNGSDNGSSNGMRGSHSGRLGSSWSGMSNSSVSPSDSASNVLHGM